MVGSFGTGAYQQKRRGRPLIDVWALWQAGLLDPCQNRISVVLSDGNRHEIRLSCWQPRPDWRHGASLPRFHCPVCDRGCWRLWAADDGQPACRTCAGIAYEKRIPAFEYATWGNPAKAKVRATLALGRRLRRARILVRAARRRKDISDAGN